MKAENIYLADYKSPIGDYTLAHSSHGLVFLGPSEGSYRYIERWKRNGIRVLNSDEQNRSVIKQLDAYFAGELHDFIVTLDLRGTLFQKQVWEQLYTIQYGKTCSYGDIAQAIGRKDSARPAGQAVGHNPISIIVPCHRIVGSDGSLTGYGGGLWRKIALLKLEGVQLTDHHTPSRIRVLSS